MARISKSTIVSDGEKIIIHNVTKWARTKIYNIIDFSSGRTYKSKIEIITDDLGDSLIMIKNTKGK